MDEPVTCPLCGAPDLIEVDESPEPNRWACGACAFSGEADTLEKVRSLQERPPRGWRLRLEAAEADASRYRDLYETRSEYVEVLEGLRDELEARIAELQTPRAVLEGAVSALRERGAPLVCPASDCVHIAKGGVWVTAATLTSALDKLDAKLETLRGGGHG